MIDLVMEGDSREVSLRLDGLDKAFQPAIMAANLFARRIHDDVVEQIERRFQTETDPTGHAWLPLAPFTQEMREAGGFGPAHPINVRTGELKRHLLDNRPNIVPTPQQVTYTYPGDKGSAEVQQKLGAAQRGATQKGYRPTPPRPVLGFGESDLALILMSVSMHIADYQPGSGTGLFEA